MAIADDIVEVGDDVEDVRPLTWRCDALWGAVAIEFLLRGAGLFVYTADDLMAWADRGTRSSTSEIRRERVYPARRILPAEMVRPES